MSNPTIHIEETSDNFVHILDPKMDETLASDTIVTNDMTNKVTNDVSVDADADADVKVENDTIEKLESNKKLDCYNENNNNDDNEDYENDDDNEDYENDDDYEDDDNEDSSTPSSLPDLISASSPVSPPYVSSHDTELIHFYKTNYMTMLGLLGYVIFLVICSYTLIVLHMNKNC